MEYLLSHGIDMREELADAFETEHHISGCFDLSDNFTEIFLNRIREAAVTNKMVTGGILPL